MNRFLAAILSTVIFASIYSAISYIPIAQREADNYYFGFFETMSFTSLYAGSVYVLVAIPLSLMIDHVVTTTNARYVKKLVIYSIFGLLIGSLFPLILVPGLNSIALTSLYALIGLMASTIYYHSLLWLPVREKPPTT